MLFAGTFSFTLTSALKHLQSSSQTILDIHMHPFKSIIVLNNFCNINAIHFVFQWIGITCCTESSIMLKVLCIFYKLSQSLSIKCFEVYINSLCCITSAQTCAALLTFKTKERKKKSYCVINIPAQSASKLLLRYSNSLR